ncbi:MAG: DNA polymerase A family protein [Candidatus Poseidoniales archaeon]
MRDNEEVNIARAVLNSMTDDQVKAAKRFFDRFSEYKKLTKLHSVYIEGARTALKNTGNSRMYVKYNIDGTVTGRISNSGANVGRKKENKIGVSFHTLPRESLDVNIRDYVVAPKGHDFITIDMKAMELRVLAHVANEENMIHAFKSGVDLHSYSAGLTFNKDPKDVSKLERQIAKEVSFLTVYGGTAYTLASKRNIPEERAEEIINSWMRAFPGVGRYMDTIDDYIKQFAYAKTIFGRYRHLPNVRSPFKNVRREAFRQGLNFTIQSAASDILLCGMLGVIEKLKGMKAKVVATVHDSIELIAPKSETKKVVEIVKDELENYHYLRENFHINLKVPLAVDVEVGSSFGNGVEYEG